MVRSYTPKDPLSKKVHGIGIEQRYVGLASQQGLDLNAWIRYLLEENEHLRSNIANLQHVLQEKTVTDGAEHGN